MIVASFDSSIKVWDCKFFGFNFIVCDEKPLIDVMNKSLVDCFPFGGFTAVLQED
jgi:hypothetical protein